MRARSVAVALTACLALAACSGGESASVEPVADATGAPAVADQPDAPDAPGATADDGATDDGATDADADADPDASDQPAAATEEPTSSAAPTATATSAPGDGANSGSGQSAATPIPAGTYTYATTGTSQLGENPEQQSPAVTTLVARAANGKDEQLQIRDRRDEEGYGSRNTVTIRYGVAGATLLASTLESTVDIFGSPFTSKNDLVAEPPVIVGPLDAQVGFKAKLHLVNDELTVDGTLEVVGREDVVIGGTTVAAFVVQVHYDLSGSIEGTSDATWWVRPGDLLNLREESRTEATSRGLAFREQYEAELTSLQPS